MAVKSDIKLLLKCAEFDMKVNILYLKVYKNLAENKRKINNNP